MKYRLSLDAIGVWSCGDFSSHELINIWVDTLNGYLYRDFDIPYVVKITPDIIHKKDAIFALLDEMAEIKADIERGSQLPEYALISIASSINEVAPEGYYFGQDETNPEIWGILKR